MLNGLLYALAGAVSHKRMQEIILEVGVEPPYLIDTLWDRYQQQRRLYAEDTGGVEGTDLPFGGSYEKE